MVDLRKKIIQKLAGEITEKYYQCPNCSDITTESDILEECSSGGAGMCYCEFNIDRTLYKWKRISKDKFLQLKNLRSLKHVQIVTKKQHKQMHKNGR